MPEHDVIVIGAGNAALAAAVAAREQGAARVLGLEKAPVPLRGGNTHYSGGLFRFAFGAVEDLRPLVPDAERQVRGFWQDLLRVTDGRTDPELAELLIGRSYDTVSWIAKQGIVLEPAVSLSAVRVGDRVKWSPGAVIRARQKASASRRCGSRSPSSAASRSGTRRAPCGSCRTARAA